jgi:hypothetical protein
MAARAKKRTYEQLLGELDGDGEKAKAMLTWFESRLATLNRQRS